LFFFVAAAVLLPLENAWTQTVSHPKADLPAQDEIRLWAVGQDSQPPWRYLKGSARIETTEFDLSADEIDYNSDTNWAYARGHVHLEHFVSGDKLNADRGEYNLKTQEGKFYVVDGTSPAKIMSSPGVLTTTNPFYFRAQWAERIRDRYILHKGFLTDCKIPKPWWTFEAPIFDVIPGDRAIARRTVFRLKHFPLLYLPYFYRPLGKNPRQSGFLTPNIGHSSYRGFMFGAGYYWAMNRSYDMSYVIQDFTTRGPAHTYNFRGKPNDVTDFDFHLYGVQDKGLPQPNGTVIKQGGYEFELNATTELWGFTGRLDYNYLSSFVFRQAFANSFAGAIFSQVNSIGYLQRHFNDDLYTVNIVTERTQLFESTAPRDQVIVQKLPYAEFSGRDQEIAAGPAPVWFSFGTSGGLLSRQEQIFQTGLEVGRIDLEPRVMTAFSFKGFSLNPAITFGATDYGNSYAVNTTSYSPVTSCGGYPSCPPAPTSTVTLGGANLFRKDADFTLDFRLPVVERIFTPPKWMHLGPKVKHVIEGQATYEYVTGVNEFRKIIHFDATDILSNTNQLTISLTNRLYRKDKNGNVNEVLSWKLLQARYFDPTFGGAVLPGQRNVVLATEEVTPFTFLDGPRNYSPVVSLLRFSAYSFFSFDYRAEYDPLRHKFLDHTVSANFRHGKYFANIGDTAITTNPLLVPQANQMGFGGGYGNTNRKGWNAAAAVDYDLLLQRRLFELVQGSYNTDCCGFSVQLRRFNIGIRDENQYLFSFSVANIGTFGSLQKQARIF
jgi:LPS-assembly protein